MIHINASISNYCDVKIPFDILSFSTYCPTCDKEVAVDYDEFLMFVQTSEFPNNALYCEDCARDRREAIKNKEEI